MLLVFPAFAFAAFVFGAGDAPRVGQHVIQADESHRPVAAVQGDRPSTPESGGGLVSGLLVAEDGP